MLFYPILHPNKKMERRRRVKQKGIMLIHIQLCDEFDLNQGPPQSPVHEADDFLPLNDFLWFLKAAFNDINFKLRGDDITKYVATCH